MSGPTNITTQSSAEPELLAWSALYCFAARCLVDPLLASFARVADVDTAEAIVNGMFQSFFATIDK